MLHQETEMCWESHISAYISVTLKFDNDFCKGNNYHFIDNLILCSIIARFAFSVINIIRKNTQFIDNTLIDNDTEILGNKIVFDLSMKSVEKGYFLY